MHQLVILVFHTFTGSNVCSKFAGRTKEWCMKGFMSCNDMILDTLASTKHSPVIVLQLERFACLLYRSKVHTKVNGLHWFLYSNCQAERESLLPTSGSLEPHILREHYIAMIWIIKACKKHPSLSSPNDYSQHLRQ